MNSWKKILEISYILIGMIVLSSGMYHLGYHHALEFMRNSDSGLGGLAEWGTAWVKILVGLIFIGIGFIVRAKSS